MSIYDNANIKGYNPNAGQQQPEKYPYVGDAYRRYGEQPGYVYSPRDDRYYRDPAAQDAVKRYEEEQGLREKEPKQPGLLSAVAPMAGTLGALYLAKSVGENAVPAITSALGSGGASGGAGAVSAGTTVLPDVVATGGGASNVVGGAVPQAASPGLFSGVAPMAGTAGGAAALGGIAAATYLGGKSAVDMLRGKEDKSLAGKFGRATLGIATGGLSELARPFLGHKSTRQRTKENTQGLLSVAQDDPTYQNYVQGMRQQYESAPVDPSKPFAGKYASFDEYEKAGLEAADLTGVYGNIKQYGPEWAKLTQEQRQAITQENINRGNYYSEGGDVLLKDQKAAQEAYDAVMGKTPAATPQVRGAAPLPPRSETLSPGIGKDGKPINRGLLTVR